MSQLRVAVVGAGIGKQHVLGYKTLSDQYEVVAICDLNLERARDVAAEFGIERVVTNMGELLSDRGVDVIDICTPPYLHYEQIHEVVAAGKHVVCEKPLVRSVKEADDLIRLEAQSGKRIMPIFQYRFGSGLQKLKMLRERGLTGNAYLSTVETSWRRRPEYYAVPWRGKWQTELGGVIVGHAVHAHDMLCYILGPVKSVYARLTTQVNPIEVEDTISASLLMADGSLASLSATLGSSVEITRHRFCFSNLVAESNTRPYTNSGDPWTFQGDSNDADHRIQALLASFEPQPEGFAGQFARFHAALRDNTPIPVTVQDARASLELITAMYHSSETNAPVELPLGPDHPKYEGWH